MKKIQLLFSFIILISSAAIAQDTIPPTINLNTPKSVCHQYRTPYDRVQPTVTDNVDSGGNISIILVRSDVNENVKGIYADEYQAIDKSGNIANVVRTVLVSDCNSSNINKINELENVTVFPNPSIENFQINIPVAEANLEILSMDGKLVYQTKLIQGLNSINANNLNTGLYQIVITTESSKKVVSQSIQ
ncbi:MAG: T9SS type A sorting domain-containing protein [Bacteroidia bacterium]